MPAATRNHKLAAVLAAMAAIGLTFGAPAAGAHGWDYVFISHDTVKEGVQSHGGTVTEREHFKYITEVRMLGCFGECEFSVDGEGNMTYASGGTVRVLAENTKTCFRPEFNRTHGGHTCDAMTSVVSRRDASFCWSEVRGTVFARNGDKAHSGYHRSNIQFDCYYR